MKRYNPAGTFDKEVPYVRAPSEVITATQADGTITVQHPAGPQEPRRVVADLVVRMEPMDLLIDVTICDPSAPSYRDYHNSHCEAGAAARAREAVKLPIILTGSQRLWKQIILHHLLWKSQVGWEMKPIVLSHKWCRVGLVRMPGVI